MGRTLTNLEEEEGEEEIDGSKTETDGEKVEKEWEWKNGKGWRAEGDKEEEDRWEVQL